MRIVHLSTFSETGGAAKATLRLHLSLREAGVDSHLYASILDKPQPACHSLRWREGLWARIKRKAWKHNHPEPSRRQQATFYSQAASWTGAHAWDEVQPCDLLHLHWCAALAEAHIPAPMDILELANVIPTEVPVLITLHDMHTFTGGCHYALDCRRYHDSCGQCPQLTEPGADDASAATWKRREKAYQQLDTRLHFHATSNVMHNWAKSSSLAGDFPIHTLPLGVDTSHYHPRDSAPLRQKYGLPESACIILFVSDSTGNPLKGMDLLAKALEQLEPLENVCLLSVGRDRPQLSLALPQEHLGHLAEAELAEVYALSDIFAFPSRQEAFGQTLLEAMACGCAVAACPSGAAPDIIEHAAEGLLADSIDAAALAVCIRSLIQDGDLRRALGQAAAEKARDQFALPAQAQAVKNLYTQILQA
ncbi:MAG: glycosyltransferase [Verrucomicrobiota bacterium]